jgi:hypothetical protein
MAFEIFDPGLIGERTVESNETMRLDDRVDFGFDSVDGNGCCGGPFRQERICRAHNALIQSTRPGVRESELASVVEFVCRGEGAQDLAYEAILTSGKNHAYGHDHNYGRILTPSRKPDTRICRWEFLERSQKSSH